ncbi:MAG: ribonuclease P protein component [Myxococcales bacterium]
MPRAHRLRRRREIKRVQDGGSRFVSGVLVLMVSPNPEGRRRLGVTVSSRVGNSVIRSKVKRRFREIFRHRRALLPDGCDVVMVARTGADQVSYQDLEKLFEAAAQKARRKLSPAGSASNHEPAPSGRRSEGGDEGDGAPR